MAPGSVQRRGSGKNASSNTPVDPAKTGLDTVLLPQPGHEQSKGSIETETILFKNHRGDQTYIWPYQLCQDVEMIASLIEEAYSSDHHLDEIKQRKFDMKTESGAIILPSVWPSIVRPASVIQISFWSDDFAPSPEFGNQRPELPSPAEDVLISRPRPRAAFETVYASDSSHVLNENHAVDYSTPSEDTDSESLSSSSTDAKEQFQAMSLLRSRTRQVVQPIDAEGNNLSFSVNTSKVARHLRGQGSLEKGYPSISEPGHERFRVSKALASGIDAETIVQIYTLPGPDNDLLRESTRVTWHHLRCNHLSFSRFREFCLDRIGLSDRLRMLAKEVLTRIQKENVKEYVDGLYIQPGTVLRADEEGRDDSQSVIFSCVPYLELQSPVQQSSREPPVFPPRTLMQAMYPSWQVQDRDAEQAYRKYGNSHTKDLVYMHNLWTMYLGTDMVVTHGHRALADQMVNSIELVQEDLAQLGVKDITKTSLTHIRLVTRKSSVYIFSLSSCRSWFQFEAQLHAIKLLPRIAMSSNDLAVVWHRPDGDRVVTPSNWHSIICRTDLVSIDLEILQHSETLPPSTDETFPNFVGVSSELPFFRWPSTIVAQDGEVQDAVPTELRRELRLLEIVDKNMLTERVKVGSPINEVDKTFSSTVFYRALTEDKFGNVSAQFDSLPTQSTRTSGRSYHANVVRDQCASSTARAMTFCQMVHGTLALFVEDLDESVVLRKLWCAMAGISNWTGGIIARGQIVHEVAETESDTWYIRSGQKTSTALPAVDKHFKRLLRHCPRCKSFLAFDTASAATEHLQTHLKSSRPSFGGSKVEAEVEKSSAPEAHVEPKLDDWVISSAQLRLEESNAGGLRILSQGCKGAQAIFKSIKELSDGVRNEDGVNSNLYSFPWKLIETFRRLIVFYLAIERALHYTEEAYQSSSGENIEPSSLPHSESGLEVLRHFANGVLNSAGMVRQDLREMVKSKDCPGAMQSLSLGPEYLHVWLMRRLLCQPLEGGLSIGAMYRKYLNDIQFQVNDRPGKRLIRSINLLREELDALVEINGWQENLVSNLKKVLDDTTYQEHRPCRHAMFPYESALLESSGDSLYSILREYRDLIDRCGPLADQAKQSLEIYEEDHGKAIQAFTIVTVIFLPLSFVTSFFGMNTSDIRDMSSGQTLFWAIALPLTFVTIGATMLIGYNGDMLRSFISSTYYRAIGKNGRGAHLRGKKSLRRQAQEPSDESNGFVQHTGPATKVEYEMPKPDYISDDAENTDSGSEKVVVGYRSVSRPRHVAHKIPRPSRRQSDREQAVEERRYTEERRHTTGYLPEYTWEKRHRRRRPGRDGTTR